MLKNNKGVDIVLVFIFFCFKKKKKNICLIEQYVVKFRWNMIKIVKKKIVGKYWLFVKLSDCLVIFCFGICDYVFWWVIKMVELVKQYSIIRIDRINIK